MNQYTVKKVGTTVLAIMLLAIAIATPVSSAPRSQADDTQIRNEIALRRSLHFRSDEAYVRAVHTAPDAVVVHQVRGVFTPAEAKELLDRLDLEQDGTNLYEHFSASANQQDVFGGLYLDHAAGGQLVLQLVRDHPSVQKAKQTLPKLRHTNRLRIDLVDWPSERLEQQFKAISDVVEQYPALLSVNIDQRANRVLVTVNGDVVNTSVGDLIDKSQLPVDLATLVSDPVVSVRRGNVESAQTAIMAGQGWNSNGSGGNNCTLGFEVVYLGKPSMLTAGHCVSGLTSGAKVYNFSTHIGTYSGGRIDGCTINSGTCIDVGVLHMNNSGTATDDIFRGGGAPSLDVTGAVETNSYVTGYVRCFSGIASGVLCGTITSGSVTFQGSHNSRWYRDMFFTDPAPIGGDSGSPVYRGDNSTSASAAGILAGSINMSGVTNNTDAYHSKWHKAQSYFGLTLVTTN